MSASGQPAGFRASGHLAGFRASGHLAGFRASGHLAGFRASGHLAGFRASGHLAGFRALAKASMRPCHAAAFAALLLAAPGTAMAITCPPHPPVTIVDATPMYSDAKGSITDPQQAARSRQQLAGIEAFYAWVEQTLDGPADPAAIACAWDEFGQWAQAGALLQTASNEAAIQRLEYLVGLNLIALKFRAHGHPPTPAMLGWIGALVTKVMENYQHNPRPDIRGNLFYWSGVDAALFALLAHHAAAPGASDAPAYAEALAYQDAVWREAIGDIQPDGTLVREMKRGQRALIYHQFAFSALLVLRAAREALGRPVSAGDDARLHLLADMIGRSLCHGETLARQAGVAKLELPGEWGYRMISGFAQGFLSPQWQACGVAVHNAADVRFGGVSPASFLAVREAGR
jgi:poly(beta-D-mannuronate) lyase